LSQVYRRLPTELGQNWWGESAVLSFVLQHVAHRLFVERFEVEPARGIEVGTDCLGIGVNHHALNIVLAQGDGCPYRAVVELDALTDADRAGAEHHDFGTGQRWRFVLRLESAIEVRGGRLELRRACVDHLVRRPNAPSFSTGPDAVGEFVQ